MKTIIKREITITLDELEAQQIRNLMIDCRVIWKTDKDLSEDYQHTVLPELWKVLSIL